MPRLAVVTIASNNYLHFARTLMQSVAIHHPEADRFCVIVDRDEAPAGRLSSEFHAVRLAELALPGGDDFLFQYTILELNTAVKPWAMKRLMDLGYDQIVYLDPDIRLYAPLAEAIELLRTGSSIVLTPHLTAPVRDDRKPGELDIRRAGAYNLGFCAVARDDISSAFMQWWQSKLARNCIVDFENGVFVDQSWIDLVPGLFPNVSILRHSGYNVAYWNVAERPLSRNEARLFAGAELLVFFHFSGLDPSRPELVSKHQDRFGPRNLPALAKGIFEDYASCLRKNGFSQYRSLPYGYGFYDDGYPVLDAARVRYRSMPALREAVAGQPFRSRDLIENAGPQPSIARLEEIYAFLLGRAPDEGAVRDYLSFVKTESDHRRLAQAVATSAEARATPGWIQRLICWRMRGALHPYAVGIAKKHGLGAYNAADASPAIQLHPPSEVLGLNLSGYVTAELGLGEQARMLALACREANVQFSLFDVGFDTVARKDDRRVIEYASASHFPIDLLQVNADRTPAVTQYLSSNKFPRGYRIGSWAWEQTRLPESVLPAFELLDEIWVPSTFVHDAVSLASPLPVTKVRIPVECRVEQEVSRARFGLPEDKLLALAMFDFDSYQYRKNPQAAIEAFRAAAADRQDSALVIKTINSKRYPSQRRELADMVQAFRNVYFLDEYLSRLETWQLQKCCDLLISLHRAEGFGLALAEMMYLGKPVVATGWSGNMEFMTADNSCPVRFELKPLEKAVGPYLAGLEWAEADIGHASSQIRMLLESAEARRTIGQRAAADVRRLLSPSAVGAVIRERLLMVARRHPHLAGAGSQTRA